MSTPRARPSGDKRKDLKAPANTMGRTRPWSRTALTGLAAFSLTHAVQAIEFGPNDMFSLTGFAEASAGRVNNQCPAEGCQLNPDTDRQRIWADAVVPGRPLSSKGTTFTQTQLWLGAKHDLGGGYRLSGMLSQNWRDGSSDTPGFWREKNVALSHEDWGTLMYGHTVSRTWQLADYPYGTQLGLAFPWAGTGAGYRNLTRALRYTSRVMDVAEGDLVLELTYDGGDKAFKVNRPRFMELWAHYGRGDWSVDLTYQDTRNGIPSAFGAAPFKGPFYDTSADGRIGQSGHSVALLQTRYRWSPELELYAGLRRNRWSGAYATVALPGPPAQFNFMFNVDWFGSINGVPNPGYPATSTDVSLGARYRMDKWTFATGLLYYGQASTRNPSERGQRNAALVNTVVVSYQVNPSWELSAHAGMVHYRRKGLSPLSMPSNATLNNIDSRATKAGNWFGVTAKYSF